MNDGRTELAILRAYENAQANPERVLLDRAVRWATDTLRAEASRGRAGRISSGIEAETGAPLNARGHGFSLNADNLAPLANDRAADGVMIPLELDLDGVTVPATLVIAPDDLRAYLRARNERS